MLRVVAVLAVVGACRIGFDPVGGVTPHDDAALDGDGLPLPPDASSGVACNMSACDTAGGTCVNDVCAIVGGPGDRVSCPPGGGACDVTCTGFQGCSLGAVSCNGARPCIVSCIGQQTCGMGVDCGTSTCEVTCSGLQTCLQGVTVDPGGTCAAHCCGAQACGAQVGDCAYDAVCS